MVCLFRKDLHEELLKRKMPKPKKEIEVSRSDDARESVTPNPRRDSKPETILVLPFSNQKRRTRKLQSLQLQIVAYPNQSYQELLKST